MMNDTPNDATRFREGQRVRVLRSDEHPELVGNEVTLTQRSRLAQRKWFATTDDGTEVEVYSNEIEPLDEPPTETITAKEAANRPDIWRDVEQGVKEVVWQGELGASTWRVRRVNPYGLRPGTYGFEIDDKLTFWGKPSDTLLLVTRLKPPGDYSTALDADGRLADWSASATSARTAVEPPVVRENADLRRQLREATDDAETWAKRCGELSRQLDRYKAAYDAVLANTPETEPDAPVTRLPMNREVVDVLEFFSNMGKWQIGQIARQALEGLSRDDDGDAAAEAK